MDTLWATFRPRSQNVVVTKLFAPKFCAELSDRELPSSHGDHFRDNFCFYVSGQLSGDIFGAPWESVLGGGQPPVLWQLWPSNFHQLFWVPDATNHAPVYSDRG